MIKRPEHNDIIINFYRAKVYKFDKNNMQHLKDISRCRYATFEEREKFLKLNKAVASLTEVFGISNKSKWKYKEYPEVTIKLNDKIFTGLLKLAKKENIFDYGALILKLLKIVESKGTAKSKCNCKKLTEENKKLRDTVNKFKKMLNEL